MNQMELIGKVLATDQQAKAMAQDAIQAEEGLEDSIAQEIAQLEQDYQAQAAQRLSSLQAAQQEQCRQQLSALDQRLQQKLSQVEALYAAKKDEWVDTIVQRIVGKAGD